MTDETAFIALLRDIATAPGARGLTDDAAVMAVGGERLVLTHDMLVQGVHFRTDDPAEDVAWKLVAVNMSDLAAKGAQPLACMLGYGLAGNDQWNKAFVAGLGAALDHYGAQLLGGDTVRQPAGDARALGLTAIGKASGPLPPSRSGALAGDGLFVTGTIGDGWAGLQLLEAGKDAPARLVQAYRRPVALVDQGRGLAQIAHAMMDVSDGLLLDASRMAQASGLALCIDLDAIRRAAPRLTEAPRRGVHVVELAARAHTSAAGRRLASR